MSTARPPIDGGVILITGASSGIGRELARQVAPRAKTLILVARRAARLAELRDELLAQHPRLEVDVRACDLGDGAAAGSLAASLAARAAPVDVLINNAGLGDFAPFDRAAWPNIEQMLRVNVIALTLLTHRLLASMVERGRGGVLNVSSGLGLFFVPLLAVYTGTKHFVTGFTESLRLDLDGTGVAVSQLCPGPVFTEFHERAGSPGPSQWPIAISAEQCAREALRGFERGRALILPGRGMKLLVFLGAFTPRFLLRLLMRPISRLLRRRAQPLAGVPSARG